MSAELSEIGGALCDALYIGIARFFLRLISFVNSLHFSCDVWDNHAVSEVLPVHSGAYSGHYLHLPADCQLGMDPPLAVLVGWIQHTESVGL